MSIERPVIRLTLSFFAFITCSAVAQTEAADAIPAGENSELLAALDPDRSGTASGNSRQCAARGRSRTIRTATVPFPLRSSER